MRPGGPWEQAHAALAFAADASRPVPTTDSTGADLLTEEECTRLLYGGGLLVRDALQSAARIGAERERERAAKWLEEQAEKIAARQPYEGDDGSANKARAWEAKLYAVAIRRGEGG
jgi:post-segregation antitoxin (ccd killing protein)